MTCQRQGLQFNCDRKRNKKMKMKHAFGPIILACVLFFIIILIPSKSLVSLISDKKVADAATSLQKRKITKCILATENVREFAVFTDVRFI